MYLLKEKSVYRSAATVALVTALLALGGCGQPAEQSSEQAPVPASAPVTVVLYEGARLLLGDGTAIENGAFTVDNGQFVAVGSSGEVSAPAGAARVDLSGMTVMPAIVDAHTHMSTTREALIDDLERRAYFGIGAAISMGSDGPDAPLEMRGEVTPSRARFLSAGHGITGPEPGRRVVHWVTTEDEARQAVRDEAARDVDLIKIWVDDRDNSS